MKLLIHHHAPVFQDEQGLHVQSFIGYWVKALSPYFEEIGLLFPGVSRRSETQDTLIDEPNICFYPLPAGGKRLDYFRRKRQIQSICRDVSPRYDVLLIRGLTPRQWTVWQSSRTPQKAFLLVGSLLENRPRFGLKTDQFLTWAMMQLRRREFERIAKGGILLANSPQLVREIETLYQRLATFISSNTIRQQDIKSLVFRKIGKPCRLLFCGRVVQDKGIEDLITALDILHSATEHDFRLSIIGTVTPDYRSTLMQLAATNKVSELIDWQGFIPFGERLLQHYESADFFVLPSYHEGFPHSIWEAALSSTPVLITAVGGIPGLIDHTMATFVPMRSPSAIAQAVSLLIKDESERRKRVELLYKTALKYTVEAGARQLTERLHA